MTYDYYKEQTEWLTAYYETELKAALTNLTTTYIAERARYKSGDIVKVRGREIKISHPYIGLDGELCYGGYRLDYTGDKPCNILQSEIEKV